MRLLSAVKHYLINKKARNRGLFFSMKKIIYILFPAILLLALITYFPNIIHLEYVWDDNNLFLSSDGLRKQEKWLEAIVQPIIPGTTYFRPFALLTFAIEFWIFGVNPSTSHLINIGLHMGNAIFMAFLIAKVIEKLNLRQNTTAITLAALIYLVHPALIESSVWVAGRFDLLATFFSIACLYFYLSISGALRVLLVISSFILGAFSKEMIFTMPVLILVLDYFLSDKSSRFKPSFDAILISALMAAFLLAYIALKSIYMPSIVHVDEVVIDSYDGNIIKYIAYIGYTCIFYIKMSIFPFFSINPYHKFLPKDMGIQHIFIGIAALTLATIFTLLAIIKKNKQSFLFILFLISLTPVLHIIPLTIAGSIGQERFLAFPLTLFITGCVTLLAYSECRNDRQKTSINRIMAMLAILYLTGAMLITRSTIPFWQDNLSLWTWVDIKNDGDPAAKTSLAFAMLKKGMPESAIAKADEVRVLTKMGKLEEGLDLRISVIKAQAYVDLGQYQHAIEILNNFLKENKKTDFTELRSPKDSYKSAYHALFSAMGEATLHLGYFKESEYYLDLALTLDKNGFYAIYLKSLASYSLGRKEESVSLFNEAKSRYPQNHRETLENMRMAYIKELCSSNFSTTQNRSRWDCEK